jgi:hypothetical protein
MKNNRSNLSQKDWELCCRYVQEMTHTGLLAHEPWELELETWAANPDRYPRKSTVKKLRIRFPNEP